MNHEFWNNFLKIEIPDNALRNFLDIFPILQLFEQHLIKKNVKLKLNFNKDLTSNFQVCFNYLNYYSNNLIDDNNIVIPGISLYNGISIQVLPIDQCELLLNQYLTINNPNYYQINSFISILGEEFKMLSNNIYLNVEEIKIKLNNRHNLIGIRSFFIQCLIEVTKHFIKGAYDDIIKEQNQVEKNLKNNNDNNDDTYNKNLRTLISTKKVSFDKVDPSLIIFNDDKQSITIIATCNKNTPYYSKLKSLYNSQNQSGNDEKDCIDYKN